MRVVIPAAGLGSRFREAGLGAPKELLPLGGLPVIHHACAEAARAGFEAAVVVTSPAKPELAAYLAAAELPLPVEVAVQAEPRGPGDAVLGCWRGDPVGVLYPDDVVEETDHWRALLAAGGAGLCVRRVPWKDVGRFGIAEVEADRVVRVVEKPAPSRAPSNLAIFGRYLVTEAVVVAMRAWPGPGELQLTEGFAGAIATGAPVAAVAFAGSIYDCGTPLSYEAARAAWERDHPQAGSGSRPAGPA